MNLDDAQAVTAQSGESAIVTLRSVPDQYRESFEAAMALEFPESYRFANEVLVCGMGGSRWPALIIESAFRDHLRLPLLLNADPLLPGWVDDRTLVVLSSYSGTTDEPIANGRELLNRKHPLLTGVAHGAGIADILRESGAPHYLFDAQHNPSGQPRNGYGYTLGALLGILVKLGILEADPDAIRSSFDRLRDVIATFDLDRPLSSNLAKRLASRLHDRYPYLITGHFLEGVGNAFQNQINETAKAIATYRIIPEINHHLMEGLSHPQWHHDGALFLFCHSPLYHPDHAKRFAITREVIEKQGIASEWIDTEGETPFDHALYLLLLGNWTALYLSALYGENPNAIPYVDYFKQRMRE